jgi:hypothetical protein
LCLLTQQRKIGNALIATRYNYFSPLSLLKKKGPDGPVGIKNSWKYEKDLIIFNPTNELFTIIQLAYINSIFYSPEWLVQVLAYSIVNTTIKCILGT